MEKRFVALWFRFLETDYVIRRHRELTAVPFVLAQLQHGRKVVTAMNQVAGQEGITLGMTVADGQASIRQLQSFDAVPGQAEKLLTAIGQWCDRFTPVVALDGTDGLLMNITGCAHLWGGEAPYLQEIMRRLNGLGYYVQGAVADTAGAAWAMARYGIHTIVPPQQQREAILQLHPAALRLEMDVIQKLDKLGFRKIESFLHMQRSALRRRFGDGLLLRLDQALGAVEEVLIPLVQPAEYRERLPCLEPICTRTGIELALQELLNQLCNRLEKEGKGIRKVVFSGSRADGRDVQISISTVLPSVSVAHLCKLFEPKIDQIAPGPGIELFTLDAPHFEDLDARQEALFEMTGDLADKEIAELVDRLSSRLPGVQIRRYLPSEHFWPEDSLEATDSLTATAKTSWPEKPRPVALLPTPEQIEVMAPIPDYPPMNFRYKGAVHTIKKADGPERIERAWWMDSGEHRDYYCVEDEKGRRYWVFRSGHYNNSQPPGWYLHGFFA